jgi:hypothetical protein
VRARLATACGYEVVLVDPAAAATVHATEGCFFGAYARVGGLTSSSRLVRCLRKERCQDLLHALALALGAVWTPLAMLGKWLDAFKYMMALATAIFVGRHGALQS